MGNINEIFARGISEADVTDETMLGMFDEAEQRSGVRKIFHITYVEDGTAVTRLSGCWPLGSDLGGGYEHAAGIYLDVDQVRTLDIEIEGGFDGEEAVGASYDSSPSM
jgi:hypothetical protein